MSHDRPLRGSCHCGRNRYIVEIPSSFASEAEVFFDNTSTSRRTQAAPLTAWLRVPLSWYHSSTYAYFADETHASIRRTYVCQPHEGAVAAAELPAQRQFCGYCGTHLSSWTEQTRERAECIDVTLGSLVDEDLEILEAVGLLGEEEEEQEEGAGGEEGGEGEGVVTGSGLPVGAVLLQDGGVERARGSPWFEEMVEDSRLGRVRRQKGGHTSLDGSVRVEWEVVEIGGGEAAASTAETTRGKRKLRDVEGGSDVDMAGGASSGS